jgi:hypothetical protein
MAESIANACSLQPGKSVPKITSECATIRPESVGLSRRNHKRSGIGCSRSMPRSAT